MEDLHILKEKLTSSDEEARRQALSRLSGSPVAESKIYLFQAMGDESWRVRKEAVDVFLSAVHSSEMGNELVDLLRSHDNAGLRNSAVEALTKLGSAALQALHDHATDMDQDVRKFVIDIMGSIGDVSSVPVLLHALEDHDANVCAAAAENLGKIRDVRAVPKLVQSLSKTDVWLRYTILEALGKIGEPVPMGVVTPLAGENLLKKAVFDCLGTIGNVDAVPVLIEGVTARVKNAREAAVCALVKIREKLSVQVAEKNVDIPLKELSGSSYVDGLVALLETSDSSLREAVVKLLAIIGDERTSGDLLKGCKDERLRRFCLQAFRSMGEAGMSSLMHSFPTADQEEKCFIAYLCGEIGFKGSAPMLKEGMHDLFPMLRKASVISAGKIGLIDCIIDISDLLDDDDSDVRDGAIEAMSRLAKKDAETVLKVALRLSGANASEKRRNAALLFGALGDADKLSLLIKDEDAMVRKVAVGALAELKLPASVGHLVIALADEDPDVRIAAVAALGEIGGDKVFDALILALRDDDLWVKCAALKSLGKLGGEKALGAIVSVLDNADGLVMIAALESLERIGGPQAMKIIRKALEHGDEEVVKGAIEILGHHDDAWIDEYRERLLAHPHWDVRNSFVRAFAERWGAKALPYLRQAYDLERDEMVKTQIREQIDRF